MVCARYLFWRQNVHKKYCLENELNFDYYFPVLFSTNTTLSWAGWLTGQMNQIWICPIWGQNICERGRLWLWSSGYFYDYGLNALRGIACLDLHTSTLFICTYTDWGKGQSWGQTIFRGKVSCCNIISSYYALGQIGKNVGQKLCQRFYAHIYAGCLWIIQEGSITITFGEWKLFMSESIVCREQLGLWLTLAVARGWEACSREKSTRIFGYLSCIHKRGGGKPCHLFRK